MERHFASREPVQAGHNKPPIYYRDSELKQLEEPQKEQKEEVDEGLEEVARNIEYVSSIKEKEEKSEKQQELHEGLNSSITGRLVQVIRLAVGPKELGPKELLENEGTWREFSSDPND